MMPLHDPELTRRIERDRRRSVELVRRMREAKTEPDGDRSRRQVRRPS
jgi:hypothetical protein